MLYAVFGWKHLRLSSESLHDSLKVYSQAVRKEKRRP